MAGELLGAGCWGTGCCVEEPYHAGLSRGRVSLGAGHCSREQGSSVEVLDVVVVVVVVVVRLADLLDLPKQKIHRGQSLRESEKVFFFFCVCNKIRSCWY